MKGIAVSLLLSCLVLAAGCSRRNSTAKQVAALDDAYRSGVLNQAEYHSRRAALVSHAQALEALGRVRDAGLVTNEEYAAKRAALLSSEMPSASPEAAPLSAATQPQPSVPVADSAPANSSAQSATAPTQPSPVPTQPSPTSPSVSAPPPVSPSTPGAQVAAASPAPPQTNADQGHVLRMKLTRTVDAQGFEKPITSATMLVPVDWNSQGATSWNIKDKCNTIQTTLHASGPDGRAVEIFPAFTWVWADNPQALQATAAQTARMGSRPCDIMQPMSGTDFLRRNLGKFRPNAQLVKVEPVPKLLEALQKQARQAEQMAAQFRMQQRVQPDVVRGLLRYNLNGQPVEEWLVVATISTGTLGPTYDTRTMQMRQAWSYQCSAHVVGERAPQGHLEGSEAFFETILSTFRVDPGWQARVTRNAQQMQQIELKGIRDRSAIVSKNAQDIAKIQHDSYENQQRAQEKSAFAFDQVIRGVETYRNPDTGETMELSSNYGHAWVNGQGEYLLSDSPNFDPNAVFKENWKQLEHVKN